MEYVPDVAATLAEFRRVVKPGGIVHIIDSDWGMLVVEPLGAEVLLDLRAGADTLTARVDPHLAVRVKDRVRLALAEDKMHFFDPETEQVIR